MDYTNMLSGYLCGLSEDCDLVSEAIASMENYFDDMNKDELIHRSRIYAIAYLALKQVSNGKYPRNERPTTIRRHWCRNIDEIQYYLAGRHDFPGVSDDLQDKWGSLEDAESIVSISWDAKEEAYLVVYRQRR